MSFCKRLFDAAGSESYLKPAANYVQPGVEINFYAVVTAAVNRGETAIGYRVKEHADDPELDYGIVLNPLKPARFTLAETDKVIVVAAG